LLAAIHDLFVNDLGQFEMASTNLPIQLTSFIGREHEIAEVVRLLVSSRLLTLTGAAGCGKTRLALRSAAETAQHYRDGVYWVELARLADSHLVPQAVAKAVQVVEEPSRPLLDRLQDALRGKQLLLVLDNCEHLLSGCVELLETLLLLPDVNILTTSREALDVAGEMRYQVSPMRLPPANSPMQEIAQYDAIQLFIERSRAIIPQFALNAENIEGVANICQKLDGIPLAIELAAARLNVLSLEQIANKLDNRFALLTTAPQLSHNHHRTLRAAIEWSHDLLSPPEQILLRQLSVFAAGCTLTTAEAVCAGNGVEREQVLELLSSLVNKSLVVAETLQGSEAHYHLLEMIRQYAQEKLIAADEWAATHNRYLQCFLELCEETAPKLYGQYQVLWFNWLESELDNIRVALDWALEKKRIEAGLRIAVALYQFWDRRGYLREGFNWYERLNQHLDDTLPLGIRVNALTFGSFLGMFSGNVPMTTLWGQTAVALCEDSDDEGLPFLSFALAGACAAAMVIGDVETAFAITERIMELDRENPDNLMFGMQLFIRGFLAIILGKYAVAHIHLEEALRYARQGKDFYRMAIILHATGNLARHEGRFVEARTYYEESLLLFRELGPVRDIPNVERSLAYICLRLGDSQQAHQLFLRSLEGQCKQDSHVGILEGLQGFATLAAVWGLSSVSIRLQGFVLAELEQIKLMPDPSSVVDKIDYDYLIAQLKADIETATFEAEFARGRVMTLPQALECACNLPVPRTISQTNQPAESLTRRENEITLLIAAGLSNAEIAEKLVLSKRTVEKHIANVLSKLSSTNRVQIVRWAIDNGLTQPPN
jgi:predicted ATPase/DNA-binding CsgD family transcriptional regulator